MWNLRLLLSLAWAAAACHGVRDDAPTSADRDKADRDKANHAKDERAKDDPPKRSDGERSFWEYEDSWQTTRADRPTPAPPAGAPNVVVVISCTTRRDQLSPYGAPEKVTPHLSRLASQGVRFDDVIAAAPWTKAASTALLTGHHPVSIGMVETSSKRDQLILPASVQSLPERFDAAGWVTIGATGNPNLNAAFGLSRGFAAWRDSLGAVHEDHRSGTDIVAELLRRTEKLDHSRPLYLQVMLVDTHTPRHVDKQQQQAFAEPGLPGVAAAYRATLHRTDAAVRALDEGLAKLGYDASNTWFVFVADHGEGLGMPDHHRLSHGTTLYSSVTRIPLIIRGPGAPAGHVVTGLTSGVDLTPTLLALAGLPAPEGLAGMDLSASVRGAPTTPRTHAWSDSWFQQVNRSSIWTSSMQCQLDFGTRHFKADSHQDGCFDRITDPDQRRPIADKALTADLRAWRKDREAELRAMGRIEEAVLDPAVEAQLRKLGYAE
jgi:arylsulfatase A-like enzyme